MVSATVKKTFGGQNQNLHNIMFCSHTDNIFNTIPSSPDTLFKYFLKFWQVTGIKLEKCLLIKYFLAKNHFHYRHPNTMKSDKVKAEAIGV